MRWSHRFCHDVADSLPVCRSRLPRAAHRPLARVVLMQVNEHEYLRRHNVVQLFDDLTASLLQAKPDEPTGFIIDWLKKKACHPHASFARRCCFRSRVNYLLESTRYFFSFSSSFSSSSQ